MHFREAVSMDSPGKGLTMVLVRTARSLRNSAAFSLLPYRRTARESAGSATELPRLRNGYFVSAPRWANRPTPAVTLASGPGSREKVGTFVRQIRDFCVP